MYLITRRACCPSRKWKPNVLGWHSLMERYVLKNRIFKDVFSHGFRVGNLYQVARWSIGDHVNWHITSITSEVYLWGPTQCESDGDRDAWIQEEHEGTCLRYTKGNIIKGPFPSCNRSTGLGQPEEFEIHDWESHVYRWKKALYGLKQNTPGVVWEDW